MTRLQRGRIERAGSSHRRRLRPPPGRPPLQFALHASPRPRRFATLDGMRSIWKGTISFGLVNIPIAIGIATQRSDPSFRTLDGESLQPIKQQLYSPAREKVVTRDETVKGY